MEREDVNFVNHLDKGEKAKHRKFLSGRVSIERRIIENDVCLLLDTFFIHGISEKYSK